MSEPGAVNLLAVRSRVNGGAIAAGAMVALTIYVVLTILGVALGIEVAEKGGPGYRIDILYYLLMILFAPLRE